MCSFGDCRAGHSQPARGQQSAVIVDDSRRSGLLKRRSNGAHHSLDVSSDKCRRCASISPKKEIGEHRVDSERASSDSEKFEHSEDEAVQDKKERVRGSRFSLTWWSSLARM